MFGAFRFDWRLRGQIWNTQLAAKQRAEEALRDRVSAMDIAEAQAELARAAAQLRAIEKLRRLRKGG